MWVLVREIEVRIGILSRGACIHGIIYTRVRSVQGQEGKAGVARIIVTAGSRYHPQA